LNFYTAWPKPCNTAHTACSVGIIFLSEVVAEHTLKNQQKIQHFDSLNGNYVKTKVYTYILHDTVATKVSQDPTIIPALASPAQYSRPQQPRPPMAAMIRPSRLQSQNGLPNSLGLNLCE
jgi:hypothetical protein